LKKSLPMLLSLSDVELQIVMSMAEPPQPNDRSEFLRDVGSVSLFLLFRPTKRRS
jgi:hypothetical protein